jgi:hypothetical protein
VTNATCLDFDSYLTCARLWNLTNGPLGLETWTERNVVSVLITPMMSCMSDNTDVNSEDIANIFDEHIKCKFVDNDVGVTTNRMVKEPHVHKGLL